MDTHGIGNAPGFAAPEAATTHPPISQVDSAPVAVTTWSRAEKEQRNCGTDCGDGKAFAMLRERLAAKGCRLIRAYGDDGSMRYFVGCSGFGRELTDIAAVLAFAEQAGVRNA